jgi:hypothetical protein
MNDSWRLLVEIASSKCGTWSTRLVQRFSLAMSMDIQVASKLYECIQHHQVLAHNDAFTSNLFVSFKFFLFALQICELSCLSRYSHFWRPSWGYFYLGYARNKQAILEISN